MSSNIHVIRICEHCGNEFTARTTVTRFCSNRCSSGASKKRVKAEKIETSNRETQQIKTQPLEILKAKEFLTVREVANLLNCSVRAVYRSIGKGNVRAVNLGQRVTRVKRSEIDKLFVKD
jgi:excisionase family DNA binding protein